MSVTKAQRKLIAAWTIAIGAGGLLASLFLPWSHQLSGALLAVGGAAGALRAVPSDPTAWQVYSGADALLALLAAGAFVVALAGSRRARIVAFVAAVLALVFVIHAAVVPPTNGVESVLAGLHVPAGPRTKASSGPGAIVAAIALLVEIAGLEVSLTAG